MLAYWNLPEETEQTIRKGWLYTGDLGRIDEDGYIYVVDRMGDMYISGGENVYPAEVEKALLNHPKVFEAAIIGAPDAKWGKAGRAFIKLRKGETITLEEVVAFLKENVAAYKIPKSLEIVDDLPKTASGKIKKSLLAKWLLNSRPNEADFQRESSYDQVRLHRIRGMMPSVRNILFQGGPGLPLGGWPIPLTILSSALS